MNQNNYLIIMAGGAGTRFWPISRNNNPKQFHDVLNTGRTLLQQSADRFKNICPHSNIYVVTSLQYVEIVKDQLPFLSDNQVLAEPFRKNTAPCIAYACYKIGVINPHANIIISPADHIILNEIEFEKKINICIEAAKNSPNLLTLGIKPTRPDTGYGYIKFESGTEEVKKVSKFLEKPVLDKAIEFVESGEYVWNAGIFIWNLTSFKSAFGKLMPEMAEQFQLGMSHYFTENEIEYINNIYSTCENISIDYALLEKADNVSVVLGDIGWSDLGTWKSLHETSNKDESNNVVDGQIVLRETKNSIIKTPDSILAVVQGLDGYIVAFHDNVLMICKKEEEQNVKSFVELAKNIHEDYA
ncbi:MAG: mannose-1-phosphate guanylyltransferase [Bacteroidota bacterium]